MIKIKFIHKQLVKTYAINQVQIDEYKFLLF